MTWCPDAPPFVVPPLGWGAAYATRYDPDYGREVITPCSKLIVHHTASNVPAPGDEADFTRQLEAYGESRDGAAVEYHYLIYPSGVCHGGFGDTRGCHSAQPDPSAGVNYNSTAIGVSFVGYFHPPNNDTLTDAAAGTFQSWLEWMIGSGRLGVDVLERAPWNGAAGWYGHRDVFATACPGDGLYPLLPELVQLPPATAAPPEDDTMTQADWERLETIVHDVVLGLWREREIANILRQYATEGTGAAIRDDQGVRDVLQIEAGDGTLGVVRSPEYAAILAANTGAG